MGGIVITPNVGAALAGQVAVKIVTGNGAQPSNTPNTPPGPWRPPQWQSGKATYMITVPSNGGVDIASQNSVSQNTAGMYTLTPPPARGPSMFVFDAVKRARHTQQLQITEHPIQTGANISDHAYLLPFRLTLEIGISDAMDSFSPGMWVGSTSKSVSAYQTLLQLQAARVFLVLTTRLATYQNMMIEDISPDEDSTTVASLRATITFKQVFTATVSQQTISARPNATDTTQLATVQPQPVSAAVTQQYAVKSPSNPTVTGSGFWSSVVSALQNGPLVGAGPAR